MVGAEQEEAGEGQASLSLSLPCLLPCGSSPVHKGGPPHVVPRLSRLALLWPLRLCPQALK